jgi:hypothetical protein
VSINQSHAKPKGAGAVINSGGNDGD